jgi:hypothetical protein
METRIQTKEKIDLKLGKETKLSLSSGICDEMRDKRKEYSGQTSTKDEKSQMNV